MIRARQDDWKTLEMPLENVQFKLDFDLTEEEFHTLQYGHIPQEMEDKWFMYYDEGKFYFYRSWTGFCIYVVSVSDKGKIENVLVNRNSNQYTETDIERDKIMLAILLNRFAGRKGNGELIKQYLMRVKELSR